MKIKLHLASLLTLGFLCSMVFAVVLAASFAVGRISWIFMISVTIIWNFLVWLLGPYVNDLIYRLFYKITFFDYEEIKDKPYAKFIKEVCDKHRIKVPKIGIINDRNPTAFTYGSASFNARIVLTEGIFEFLNEKEVNAVVAHELGHIVNMDFIIMTIASTLVTILYELYVIFTRIKTKYSTSRSKGVGGYLALVGLVSLVFYWIGTYLLLFLSRLREYYADEFSANEVGDPNILSSALLKIAWGIASVPDTEKTAHLLNATRAQGIFDFKSSKDIGLVYQNSLNERTLLERALLFDIVNPWAWIYQLKSTHPLIGRRIKRLCSLTSAPMFNFENIINTEVDRGRLWGNFIKDFVVNYSKVFVVALTILVLVIELILQVPLYIPTAIGGLLLLIIVGIMKVGYKFPKKNFEETTVLNCLSDIYASPVRGRPIKLTGKAIGRGTAGFIFGEDMLFQDNTGFIYLNYESAIPIFGNFYFGWKKLEPLIGQPATSTGWFLRGATHHLELFRFETTGKVIKSYVRFWAVFGVIAFALLCIIGIVALGFLL
ncbi:MAG: M48 family metalloprotease [bacterium]|nr:M48 family metalloprotease [bacterium]